MTIQTTLNLTNSQRTQYLSEYMRAAQAAQVYDELAKPIPGDMKNHIRGSSVQIPFLSDLEPRAQTISQTADINTQALRDAVATVTPTSRADGVKLAELVWFQSYTNYQEEVVQRVGKNAMETLEVLAMETALQGTNVERAVARASLDAGTAGHRLTDAILSQIESILVSLMVPSFVAPDGMSMWAAIMSPRVYYDVRAGGNVIAAAQYQLADIIFKQEIGSIGHFRLVVTPWAKVFGSAGADNGTSVATTLNGAVNALAKTIVTADDVSASIAAGKLWTIGTEETGNTFYHTNELVRIASGVTNTLTIIGSGPGGGLRFDHPSGAAVRNADHVYPVAFGSPASLCKWYNPETGEFPMILDPRRTGTVDQFIEIAYKWYGGYGRWSEASIMRGEFASSLDA